MKRAGRWLFNFAAAVSVLLCIATVVLWVRSYWRCEWFESGGPTRWRTVGSTSGRLFAVAWNNFAVNSSRARFIGRNYNFQLGWDIHSFDQASSTRMGISISPRGNGVMAPYTANGVVSFPLSRSFHQFGPFLFGTGTGGAVAVVVPHWAPIAMTLVLPIVWGVRRQRVRAMIGMCAVCGYDLRATPDRCPECGAIPEGAKGAAT